jgi:hypothetical protein
MIWRVKAMLKLLKGTVPPDHDRQMDIIQVAANTGFTEVYFTKYQP